MAVDPLFARITRHFERSPEVVFDAWLDPAVLEKWLTLASEGKYPGRLARILVEPRKGGTFSFDYRTPEGTTIAQKGEYLEIVRPAHLSFSWAMALPDMERVVIDFVPAAHGTEVTLTHVMDPAWTGDVGPVGAAWGAALAAIAMVI